MYGKRGFHIGFSIVGKGSVKGLFNFQFTTGGREIQSEEWAKTGKDGN